MRSQGLVKVVCVAALALIGGPGWGADELRLLPTPREWYSLKADGGQNHSILACAAAKSGKSDVVYVVDAVSDRYVRGSENLAEGEYLLWKLSGAGEILWKQSLGKMPPVNNRPRAWAVVIPLAASGDDSSGGNAIVVGQFDKVGEWAVRRVDGDGKIVTGGTLKERGTEFSSAVLLPAGNGLLLAGRTGGAGTVWNVDFEGNVLWKQIYLSRTDRSRNVVARFYDITLVGDAGGFVVAGDSSVLNKFGIGEATAWLMRCDPEGKTEAEADFPGRRPSICGIGKNQFAVLYDADMAMAPDARVRAIGMDLQPKWDNSAGFSAVGVDGFTIAALPSGGGFVVAGANINKNDERPYRECQYCRFDAGGRRLACAAVRVPDETILNARVVCSDANAYVATRTTGMVPWDVLEAAIFKIPLEIPK